jgi:predicted phage baseplate assembly protein
MAADPPKIDPRGHDEFVAQAETAVQALTDGAWRPAARGVPLDPLGALIRGFAHFAARAADALNHAPAVAHDAFLAQIGARPRPPRAARAPLTFSLAEGATRPTPVPARTPVGDGGDVVFETEEELVVSNARLVGAFVREPAADRWADVSAMVEQTHVAAAFVGAAADVHALFVQCPPGLANADATVSLELLHLLDGPVTREHLATLPIVWSGWDGERWAPVTGPGSQLGPDPAPHARMIWADLRPPPLRPREVAGRTGLWLRADLSAPAVRTWLGDHGIDVASPRDALGQLPRLQAVAVRDLDYSVEVAVERALTDGRIVELRTGLAPFGPVPASGAICYFACPALIGLPAQLSIVLDVETAAVTTPTGVTLACEVWTGTAWAAAAGFTDQTDKLARSGSISVVVGDSGTLVQGKRVGDLDACFMRLRLVGGTYTPAPIVLSMRGVNVRGKRAFDPPAPLGCAALNDFAIRVLDLDAGPVHAFVAMADTRPALHLALDPPPPPGPCNLYVSVHPPAGHDAERPLAPTPARIVWEYRRHDGWRRLAVRDGTAGLSAPGVVSFMAPADLARAHDFDRDACWIRARWHAGEFREGGGGTPRIVRLALHTTWARHASARVRETLGVARGKVGETFATRETPVLDGAVLEVRELVHPHPVALASLRADVDERTLTLERGDDGDVRGAWVRWIEVGDLRLSRAGDRHYTLDPRTGALRFGDGQHGRLLPRGADVRLTYTCGGGEAGNLAAGSLTRLRTALPSIRGVTNLDPAVGGAAEEPQDQVRARAPARLRHRFRAVAADDFEDLAFESSPEVARARAICPAFDPIEVGVDLTGMTAGSNDTGAPVLDPSTGRVTLPPQQAAGIHALRGGRVQVLVVPHGREPQPVPSAALVADVERYLRERASPLVALEVTGPSWVRVSAECIVTARDPAGAVTLAERVRAALDAFLHPLTGGTGGGGWPFGRVPHRSDLVRCVAGVAGVHHVDALRLTCQPPLPGTDADLGEADRLQQSRLMVHAGAHTITLTDGFGEEVLP